MKAVDISRKRAGPVGERFYGLALVIALHAAAVTVLLGYEPARNALTRVAPMVVDLIVPPKPEPRIEPPIEPPKPRPLARLPQPVKAAEPPPILAASADAPTPLMVAPQPPPPPEPPAPALAPAPTAVQAPVFDAAYLENPAPAYPALSKRMGEHGRVLLRVLVNAAGTADEVQVRASSGFARLDESARDTVRRWKFVPGRRGADPVPAWVLIPISFQLEG